MRRMPKKSEKYRKQFGKWSIRIRGKSKYFEIVIDKNDFNTILTYITA